MKRGQRLRIPNDYGYGAGIREWGYFFPWILARIYVRHYYGHGCYGLDEKIILRITVGAAR
jgi:hypothetical protein